MFLVYLAFNASVWILKKKDLWRNDTGCWIICRKGPCKYKNSLAHMMELSLLYMEDLKSLFPLNPVDRILICQFPVQTSCCWKVIENKGKALNTPKCQIPLCILWIQLANKEAVWGLWLGIRELGGGKLN